MSTRALFQCDRTPIPRAIARQPWDKRLEITRRGSRDLTLRIENVSHALREQLSPLAKDMVHIAAYVYAADQLVNRIHRTDVFGDQWRRYMHLCLPVSDPAFWSEPQVLSQLVSTLEFATEDHWTFSFGPEATEEEQLVFGGAGAKLLSTPDSVFLFSGGADSLSAVVEEVAERRGRPVLVSQRPAPTIDHRQQQLRNRLSEALPQWDYPHVSVWAHRRGSDPEDSSQRARSFLYACLGAAIANSLGLERVLLADNGVVSLNIPTTQQLVGGRASRSTHPKFLYRMNAFLEQVFTEAPKLSNPLWSRTRTEVMRNLADAGVPSLLQHTNSCSHWTRLPAETPHCGVCSQCIDRRFSSLAAGMSAYDVARRYQRDIFRDALSGEPSDELTQATSYVAFARRVHAFTSDDQFLSSIRELDDCIVPSDPDPDSTMRTYLSMLRRHAQTALTVLSQQIKDASDDLAAGRLPSTCLITLNPPRVARPLEMKLQAGPLTPEAQGHFESEKFKSRLLIHITGTPSRRKSNLVLVDGLEVHLDDADFVLFLRIVLQLWLRPDGYLSLREIVLGEGDDSEEALVPRGWQQALSRLRKNFRGRISDLSTLEFIESVRGKVRLSTHRQYVVINCEALLEHENEKIQRLGARFKAAAEKLVVPV